MRLLLHICCGPCATGALEGLRAEFPAGEITGLFYNPNIHPEQEYQRRRTALARAAETLELSLLFAGEEQGIVDYLHQVAFREADRCRACYAMRLAQAAQQAAAQNYDAFSTTLLISPYQDLDAIRAIGQALGKLHGPDFLYRDLRPFYPFSRRRAREIELYQQKYCGCVFSELERLIAHARKKAARDKSAQHLKLPLLASDSFRLDLPMSSSRPFTLAGLSPEKTAQLLTGATDSDRPADQTAPQEG